MNPISSKQTGFTLIELLTVMLILVAMASVTIETTSELAFQNRYEVTKDRYEKIKQAIIGRPDVLINGQPDISGFVADVGRLPFALQELLSEGFCSDTTQFNAVDCAGGILVWTANGYGWNGPYISSNKAFDDENALSDGWGSSSAGNYGWVITYHSDIAGTSAPITDIATALSMKIQSPGSASAGTYGAVYPSPAGLINNWKITPNINLDIQPPLNFNECDITSISTQNACEAAANSWLPPHCENPTLVTSATCTTPPLTWNTTFSVCIDPSKTTMTACNATAPLAWSSTGVCRPLNSSALCSANWMRWDSGLSQCMSTSKAYCDSYIAPTSYQTQSIDITLTYNDGAGGTATSIQTATIIENGQNQLNSLTGFASVPMGDQSILVTKNGTNDIYPPSCLGLAGGSNCADAGGILLTNGICDNITIAQCEAGAGGTGEVTRNEIFLPFIPGKTEITINW